MTITEIKKRQLEITNEIGDLDIVNNNKDFKVFKKLCIENSNLQRELDKLEGRTYDSDKWITNYFTTSYVSLKDARLKLAEMISKLNGVEVGESETGVVGVRVFTEYKIYHYEIHAHYWVENIPESKRIEKGMFGDEIERYDTRIVYGATIDKNGCRWSWRY